MGVCFMMQRKHGAMRKQNYFVEQHKIFDENLHGRDR